MSCAKLLIVVQGGRIRFDAAQLTPAFG